MLKKLRLLDKTAVGILLGQKIPFLTSNADLRETFYELAGRMHAAHFIAAEPQTYVTLAEYRDFDPKYMGKTTLHALGGALFRQAESLKDIAIQKGLPITPFEVFGLNWDKRQAAKEGEDFIADPGKIPVLTRGDLTSFAQALNLIRQRQDNPGVRYTVPVVIQNSDHFWEPLLNTNGPHWKQEREKLRRLNIHVTSGRAETADLLATLSYGQKINPADISHTLGISSGDPDPDIAFATTDLLKFEQSVVGHKSVGASGLMRRLIEIIGPYQSPTEESYSHEANAEDEKFRAIYNVFKDLGTNKVRVLFAQHGYKDITKLKTLSHDGGLGFCLENAKGERRIDLFTPEHFPNSVHKLNPTQMSPGVELAYLKRTDGLEITMERLFARVREIVAEDPRFTVDDLRAYDTSLFVSANLSAMLDAIDRGEDYDPHLLQITSVFEAHVLRVSEKPQFTPSQKTRVAETENYLIPEGETRTRSMVPDWASTGPNAISYKLMRLYMGASNDLDEREPEVSPLAKRKLKRMGLLATPEMVMGQRSPAAFQAVKHSLLRDFKISTQLGPAVWHAYRGYPEEFYTAASLKPSNQAYLSNMRGLLDEANVTYFGPPDRPLTDEQKVDAYLLLLKGMVRNQVYNHTEIVADRYAAAEVLRLLEHKQMLGLVGQQTKHLLNLVDTVAEATEKIAEIVRMGLPRITPVRRHFYQDGQIENNQCMVMTVYLSASNCNREALNEAWRLGYLAKLNGFTLKTGGGNDGLMKAINDGFMSGEEELLRKGYIFPNQLINIQCVDTEAIEKPYLGGGIYRCHPHFEGRKADLQDSDFSAAIYGGIGTDEEIFGWAKSVLTGRIDPLVHPMWLMNSQMDSSFGKVGVYDPYQRIFSERFRQKINMNFTSTVEGIIDQACTTRSLRFINAQRPITQDRMLLREELGQAASGHAKKGFVPPYGIFLGKQEDLPPAQSGANKIFVPDLAKGASFQ